MNEIVNKFLLEGDKSVPDMHLRQPGFTYSACGPFTKNKKQIKKFKETGDSRYIYQNELDKACFQHDVAYGDFVSHPFRLPALTKNVLSIFFPCWHLVNGSRTKRVSALSLYFIGC